MDEMQRTKHGTGPGPASFLLLITLRNKSSLSHLWVKMEAQLGGAAALGTRAAPAGMLFLAAIATRFCSKLS